MKLKYGNMKINKNMQIIELRTQYFILLKTLQIQSKSSSLKNEDIYNSIIKKENGVNPFLTVMNLIDLEVPRIIVRASGDNQKRILRALGIQEILAPEEEFATLVAEQLINPNITAFLQLPDNYEVAEVKAPRGIANRTVEDLDLVDRYNLTLITVKRCYEEELDGKVVRTEHILGVPKAETVVYDTDTLVVFGTLGNVKRFLEINE